VEPDALPAWAEEHAASWLADCGARWDHVRGVAQQAQHVSRALDEDDRPYLVAAAWLHDIGYAPTLAATAFHPLDGARHLRALGHERLARLVADHSSARWEAEALACATTWPPSPREDSPTADALTYCDMTTSPTGQRITLAGRLAEIAERYGAEHLVVRCLQRAHDHLAGAVRRTEERLRAGGVPE
jgi:HD domain